MGIPLVSEPEMHTGEEWAALDKEWEIRDIDGWRDAKKTASNLDGFNTDYFTKLINENQYISRRDRCSCAKKKQNSARSS